jgi:hypothetical protein
VSKEDLSSLDPARRQAVSELTGMIASKYPSASFTIAPGIDDEEATHITAVVDLDDPDEVVDLIIDRLVDLQVEEELPISVIPIRTPERVAKLSQQLREQRLRPSLPPAPLV